MQVPRPGPERSQLPLDPELVAFGRASGVSNPGHPFGGSGHRYSGTGGSWSLELTVQGQRKIGRDQ